MKKIILAIILIAAGFGGGILWMRSRGDAAKPPDAAAAAPEEPKTTVTHDDKGNVVINIGDEAQGEIGLVVGHPVAAQQSPEVRGYGRVLDPAPLAALANDLATAQAAFFASNQELERTKTLQNQGNSSERALLAAQAAAMKDQLAVRALKDRLVLGWGKEIAERDDLVAFAQALSSLDAALVRIDLPGGERLSAPPTEVRLTSMTGATATGQFVSLALNVDPQTQGQGWLFLVKPNQPRMLPGEAVTGYLKMPGDAVSGVIIPREAVVRTEGAGWIYVLNTGGEAITRTEISLDHPTDAGWFVTKGATADDHIVTTGAQTLLSQELKASMKPD